MSEESAIVGTKNVPTVVVAGFVIALLALIMSLYNSFNLMSSMELNSNVAVSDMNDQQAVMSTVTDLKQQIAALEARLGSLEQAGGSADTSAAAPDDGSAAEPTEEASGE